MEIKEPLNLCLASGDLNPVAAGWSRRPVHHCNLAYSFLRKKKWDYWCFFHQNFAVAFGLADIDYANTVFAYFIDFERNKIYSDQITQLSGVEMGPSPFDNVEFDNHKCRIALNYNNESSEINLSWRGFSDAALEIAATVLEFDAQESLGLAIPFSKRRYQYSLKQNFQKIKGRIKFQDREIDLQEFVSVRDFGRGKWPYKSQWNWSHMAGESDLGPFILNLGDKWTAGELNENGLFLNGKLLKIPYEVHFEYQKHDPYQPWTIESNSNDFSLTLQPTFVRQEDANFVLIRNRVDQAFGFFQGQLTLESTTLKITNAFGFAEEVHSRW